MTDATGSRLLVLLALAVLGVTLAGIGALLGGATATDPAGEFRVSDRNLTYADNSGNRTLVENLSGVERIELERVDADRYEIETESATPLGTAERIRAERIARENETVQQALAGLDAYDLTVGPIQRLSADESVTFDTEPINGSSVDGSTDSRTFRIANASRTNESGGVVVDRAAEYVDGEANVNIEGPNGETLYSVHVDLRNETVVDITPVGDI